MATIRKRGSSWQAQVRREGFPALTKSFKAKADAVLWARETERSIDRAELPQTIRDLKGMTVADLLRRYEQEVTPKKRGARFERSRIRQLLAHDISRASLSRLSGALAATYRDDRLKLVKPASVRRELIILRHVFQVARQEWNIPLPINPVQQIKLPSDSKPRNRRLESEDGLRLLNAINRRSAWYLRPLFLMAIETGLRRGELLSLRWEDVDYENRTARIRATKNGYCRTIPRTHPVRAADLTD